MAPIQKFSQGQLEQLECLRSEDTPAAPWLPILLTSSYWIPSPYYWPVHIGSQAHTIDQFILDPKPILLTSSYWIPGHNKTESNLQIWRICLNFKLLKFLKILHVTHLPKLLDNVWKYKTDLASIVKDIEWTWFCPQMDRWTRWNQYTPFNFVEWGV